MHYVVHYHILTLSHLIQIDPYSIHISSVQFKSVKLNDAMLQGLHIERVRRNTVELLQQMQQIELDKLYCYMILNTTENSPVLTKYRQRTKRDIHYKSQHYKVYIETLCADNCS